jgi:hypothetical protein
MYICGVQLYSEKLKARDHLDIHFVEEIIIIKSNFKAIGWASFIGLKTGIKNRLM